MAIDKAAVDEVVKQAQEMVGTAEVRQHEKERIEKVATAMAAAQTLANHFYSYSKGLVPSLDDVLKIYDRIIPPPSSGK
jgi:hypothetical protein